MRTTVLVRLKDGGRLYCGSQLQSCGSMVQGRIWQSRTGHITTAKKQRNMMPMLGCFLYFPPFLCLTPPSLCAGEAHIQGRSFPNVLTGQSRVWFPDFGSLIPTKIDKANNPSHAEGETAEWVGARHGRGRRSMWQFQWLTLIRVWRTRKRQT